LIKFYCEKVCLIFIFIINNFSY